MSASSFTPVCEQIAKLKSEQKKLDSSGKRVASLIESVERQKLFTEKKHKLEVVSDELAYLTEKVAVSRNSVIVSKQTYNAHSTNSSSLSLMSGKSLLIRDKLTNEMSRIQKQISALTRVIDESDRESLSKILSEQIQTLEEEVHKQLQSTRAELDTYHEEGKYKRLLCMENSDDDNEKHSNDNTIIERLVCQATSELQQALPTSVSEYNSIYMSFVNAIDAYADQLRERLAKNAIDNATTYKTKYGEEKRLLEENSVYMKRIDTSYNKRVVMRAVDMYERAKARLIEENKSVSVTVLHHRLCAVAQRVQCVLPILSIAEIDYLTAIVLEEKRRMHLRSAYMNDFKNAVEELVEEYNIAIEIAKSKEYENEERQKVIQEREEHRRRLHKNLVQQRQVFEIKKSEKEMCKAREAYEKEKMERKAAAEQRREFELRLKALSEYLAAKQEMQKREQELAEINAAQLEHEHMLQAKRNALCVAKRNDERNQKIQRRKLLLQEVEEQRSRKEEALQRFFRSVDARLNVQVDKTRVMQSTESSKSVAPYITLAESAFSRSARGFASSLRASKAIPLHGYTDDEVMRDPRVRLYCALLDENLHRTEYGREVVNKLSRVSAAQAVSEDNPFRGQYR